MRTSSLAMHNPRIEQAVILMQQFAERTGLTGAHPPQRYLWTDAFAVCNYLGLAQLTGDTIYMEYAFRLVEQVHHLLGRHRPDDTRTGWISGLAAQAGEQHPTRGGLRIGKALAERGPTDAYDERLEWDRDGQYFHYLTKWMHALDQLARITRQPHYNAWARELAQTAFDAFTAASAPGEPPQRMVWKMSIDLTRPQVAAMGQQDPLDGYISNLQLRATAAALPQAADAPDLEAETRAYAAMIQGGDWATADPLGLGGLLSDAYRLQQLKLHGAPFDAAVIDDLLRGALAGLDYYARSGELQQPATYRLAFRELGLAIGLHAVTRMQGSTQPAALQNFTPYLALGEAIEDFWQDPAQQQSPTWTEHQDINQVMLATALVPDGFLELW